jgi:single-stranded-DNA-specific exonuclease RecJ
MSLSGKQWIWPDHDRNPANDLAEKLEMPGALARLLFNRGITDPGQARKFLFPSTDQLHSPWLMLGMKEAVERLLAALENNEKIIIHGDYDADGIAATVILVETIRLLGGEVEYYLPSRFAEGYGLHIEPLKRFKEAGFSLAVTVDCGINAVDEAAHAAKIGLDLIVTDHHQPLERLNGTIAVINPLQEECPYPFKDLSGAGIAFKLSAALMEKSGLAFPSHLLDLAALGTAADVVPLLDENRVIVSAGLDLIRSLKRVGFRALVETVGLATARINSRSLSFILAPSINAAGRMGEALPAAQLLLEKEMPAALELAGSLHQINQLRRSTEQKILAEAEEAAQAMLETAEQRVITLAGDNWHHGVIGIVSSRLVERFNRPVALIALEDGEGRGSARSVPGFDITAALAESSLCLDRFGGHEQAAGFTVKPELIEELRAGLNSYAERNHGRDQFDSSLNIEAELDASEIEQSLVTLLNRFQPFGMANQAPLFGSRGWEILSWRLVGADKKHLKLNVRKEGRELSPIVFSGAHLEEQLEKGRPLDLAFCLKNGFFRDEQTIDVEVKDLKYSDTLNCGHIDLHDRRGCRDRPGSLQKILDNNEDRAVIFVSTAARVKKIKENCRGVERCEFITGGSGSDNLKFAENAGLLILYDLPLHSGILAPIIKQSSAEHSLAVYLLYSSDDLMRNQVLIDHSLPAKEQLEAVVSALIEAGASGDEFRFPGSIQKNLGLKLSSGFWERVERILNEAGFLSEGRYMPGSEKQIESFSRQIDLSPSFAEVAKLRDSCKQFQKLLLAAPLDNIASLLHDLTRS